FGGARRARALAERFFRARALGRRGRGGLLRRSARLGNTMRRRLSQRRLVGGVHRLGIGLGALLGRAAHQLLGLGALLGKARGLDLRRGARLRFAGERALRRGALLRNRERVRLRLRSLAREARCLLLELRPLGGERGGRAFGFAARARLLETRAFRIGTLARKASGFGLRRHLLLGFAPQLLLGIPFFARRLQRARL